MALFLLQRLGVLVHRGCYNKLPSTGWLIKNTDSSQFTELPLTAVQAASSMHLKIFQLLPIPEL